MCNRREVSRGRGFVATLTVTSLMMAGCGGSGSGSGSPEQRGTLSLGVSDGPIHNAQKVCVTFDSLELKPSEGAPFTIDLEPARKVNLLDFQGANAAVLIENEELQAGRYQWVRLGVDAVRGANGGLGDLGGAECSGEGSYIVMDDGAIHNLYVPSGEQTGLKLVSGFTVPAGGAIDATAEWDLGKAITDPPGLSPDVMLKPTIRLVDNVEVGTLVGQVSNELAEAPNCEPSIYVFADGVVPNAIDGDVVDPNDPVATAIVAQQSNADGSVTFHYEVGFLVAADYEIAFTCNGETFEPAGGKPAAVTARGTTAVDFL